jgi:hypothetical protein
MGFLSNFFTDHNAVSAEKNRREWERVKHCYRNTKDLNGNAPYSERWGMGIYDLYDCANDWIDLGRTSTMERLIDTNKLKKAILFRLALRDTILFFEEAHKAEVQKGFQFKPPVHLPFTQYPIRNQEKAEVIFLVAKEIIRFVPELDKNQSEKLASLQFIRRALVTLWPNKEGGYYDRYF